MTREADIQLTKLFPPSRNQKQKMVELNNINVGGQARPKIRISKKLVEGGWGKL